MVSVAALLLMILAFAAIGYPLLSPMDSSRAISTAGPTATDDLERARDTAYGAIRQLEAEYELGRLSSDDYEALREEYVDRAAFALWRLDTAPPAARSARKRELRCPACGERRRRSDRFCGACGQALRVNS